MFCLILSSFWISDYTAKVITDRASGRSKGFAFVTYTTIEEAEKAREGMNAKFLDGWVIFVDPAKPREPRPPQQSRSHPSESGFTVNKTVGWHGWALNEHQLCSLYLDDFLKTDSNQPIILQFVEKYLHQSFKIDD